MDKYTTNSSVFTMAQYIRQVPTRVIMKIDITEYEAIKNLLKIHFNLAYCKQNSSTEL